MGRFTLSFNKIKNQQTKQIYDYDTLLVSGFTTAELWDDNTFTNVNSDISDINGIYQRTTTTDNETVLENGFITEVWEKYDANTNTTYEIIGTDIDPNLPPFIYFWTLYKNDNMMIMGVLDESTKPNNGPWECEYWDTNVPTGDVIKNENTRGAKGTQTEQKHLNGLVIKMI